MVRFAISLRFPSAPVNPPKSGGCRTFGAHDHVLGCHLGTAVWIDIAATVRIYVSKTVRLIDTVYIYINVIETNSNMLINQIDDIYSERNCQSKVPNMLYICQKLSEDIAECRKICQHFVKMFVAL